MTKQIKHTGIIEGMDHDSITVRIVQTSACAACKVAAHCNAAESKVKMIDVKRSSSPSHYRELAVGQEVEVCASREVAARALLLGFGLPFVILVAAVLAGTWLGWPETSVAVGSLLTLVPYYFALYLMRDKIAGQLAFYINESYNNN